MGATALFTAYEQRLVPDKKETDAALGRAVDCVTALADHYYNGKSPSDCMTLIGSLVKGTSVKPIADVEWSSTCLRALGRATTPTRVTDNRRYCRT